VAQVARFADAAVIGSAIVELIERSTQETEARADRSASARWETAPVAVARFIKGLRLTETALAR
jgi:tryptophan synthase alpha chain